MVLFVPLDWLNWICLGLRMCVGQIRRMIRHQWTRFAANISIIFVVEIRFLLHHSIHLDFRNAVEIFVHFNKNSFHLWIWSIYASRSIWHETIVYFNQSTLLGIFSKLISTSIFDFFAFLFFFHFSSRFRKFSFRTSSCSEW